MFSYTKFNWKLLCSWSVSLYFQNFLAWIYNPQCKIFILLWQVLTGIQKLLMQFLCQSCALCILRHGWCVVNEGLCPLPHTYSARFAISLALCWAHATHPLFEIYSEELLIREIHLNSGSNLDTAANAVHYRFYGFCCLLVFTDNTCNVIVRVLMYTFNNFGIDHKTDLDYLQLQITQ